MVLAAGRPEGRVPKGTLARRKVQFTPIPPEGVHAYGQPQSGTMRLVSGLLKLDSDLGNYLFFELSHTSLERKKASSV